MKHLRTFEEISWYDAMRDTSLPISMPESPIYDEKFIDDLVEKVTRQLPDNLKYKIENVILNHFNQNKKATL